MGSLKSNVGHTQAAAGVGGVIKMVLALQHGTMPRSLHCEVPSSKVDWSEGHVALLQEARPWKRNGMLRRAGVSSFGISGTNAHLILEEAPDVGRLGAELEERLSLPLMLSARTDDALRAQAQRWAEWLGEHPEEGWGDVVATALMRRARFGRRAAVHATSGSEAVSALEALSKGQPHVKVQTGKAGGGRLAVMFTGQGSQRAGMGHHLYGRPGFEVFTEALDAAMDACAPHLSVPIQSVMWPEDDEGERLAQTRFTQPALFALETALYRQWEAWGVRADVLMGHSIGELVAAHVAGVFSLEDAAKVVCARGLLMDEFATAGGAMASIEAGVDEVELALDCLPEGLGVKVGVAAENAPAQTVVSGDAEAVSAVVDLFAEEGRKTRSLKVSHAFHSHHMDAMLQAFASVLATVDFQRPSLPIVSNVTGLSVDVDAGELVTVDYWLKHVREGVRWATSVDTARTMGVKRWLECGPSPVLSALVGEAGEAQTVASLRKGTEGPKSMVRGAAELHLAGVDVDWGAMEPSLKRARLVAVPTYAFSRKRYWLEAKNNGVDAGDQDKAGLDLAGFAGLSKRVELSDEERALFEGMLPRFAALMNGSASPERATEDVEEIAVEGALFTRLLAMPKAARYDALFEALQQLLGQQMMLDDVSVIEEDVSFLELGMDSMMGVSLGKTLMTELGVELDATLLFDHPSPGTLSRHLVEVLLEEEHGDEAGKAQGTQAPHAGLEVTSEEDDLDTLIDAFAE